MGRMTLSEFRTEVADGLQRGTPEAIGITRVDRWLYNSMIEFAYPLKFRELEGTSEVTLLEDEFTLDFPTDFRVLHHEGLQIVGADRYEGSLTPETRAQYIRLVRTGESTLRPGRPYFYHIYDSQFYVRPVADDDYDFVIHYWKRLTMLVNEDSPSIFGDDWDDPILLGALYRGFRHFNEFDRYQNVKNDFIAAVRSRAMPEDLEEFPEGGIHPVTWRDTEFPTYYGFPDTRHEREYGEGPSR